MDSSLATPPLLELSLRPDLDVLLGRWHYQPNDTAELPACYARLAHMAEESGCRFWLQDLRRRVVNDPETTRWVLADFFPGMAAKLGGRLFVAYLFSPALHQHIINTPEYLPPEAFDSRPYALNFFGDEGEAIQWLLESQRR